jgi:hypothetical protein
MDEATQPTQQEEESIPTPTICPVCSGTLQPDPELGGWPICPTCPGIVGYRPSKEIQRGWTSIKIAPQEPASSFDWAEARHRLLGALGKAAWLLPIASMLGSALLGIPWLIGLVAVLSMVWFWRVQNQQEYRQLQSSGVVGRATIVSRKVKTFGEPPSDYDSYSITYEFTAGRSRYTRTADVGRWTYDSLKKSDSVTIIFALSDPGISRLQSQFRRLRKPSPIVTVVLTLALASFLVYAVVFAWQEYLVTK